MLGVDRNPAMTYGARIRSDNAIFTGRFVREGIQRFHFLQQELQQAVFALVGRPTAAHALTG